MTEKHLLAELKVCYLMRSVSIVLSRPLPAATPGQQNVVSTTVIHTEDTVDVLLQ